jgi:hypothetical protein
MTVRPCIQDTLAVLAKKAVWIHKVVKWHCTIYNAAGAAVSEVDTSFLLEIGDDSARIHMISASP